MTGFPLLTVITLLPAATAVLLLVVPSRRPELVRLVGVGGAVATGVLTGYLVYTFAAGNGGFQFETQHSWISSFGISWHLGVDGISLFLVALTGLLFPLAMVGPKIHHDVKAHLAWL